MNSTLILTLLITVQSRLRLDYPTSATWDWEWEGKGKQARQTSRHRGFTVRQAGKETDFWSVGE